MRGEFSSAVDGLSESLDMGICGDNETPVLVCESCKQLEKQPLRAADREVGKEKENCERALDRGKRDQRLIDLVPGLCYDPWGPGLGPKPVGAG
jgi:hypothetical protein